MLRTRNMTVFKRTTVLLLCIWALVCFSAAFAAPVSGAEQPGPLSGVIIGIDPGHQLKADGGQEQVSPGDETTTKDRMSRGGVGVRTGVNEYAINLAVSAKLASLLQNAGATVVMTRTTNDVSISNRERAELMNEAGVDLWVRIHCNSSVSKRIKGALMIAPKKEAPIGEESDSLAQAVLNGFCAATGAQSRGTVYSANQTGFNWSISPVVTIEMGYLTNPEEDTRLCRASYQDKCAAGIFEGITEYLEGRDEQ